MTQLSILVSWYKLEDSVASQLIPQIIFPYLMRTWLLFTIITAILSGILMLSYTLLPIIIIILFFLQLHGDICSLE